MVKKLFKHEIKAYLRIMLPVYICLIAVALLARVIQFFEADTVIYSLVSGSSIFVYVVATIACFGFSSVFSIVRFYKNLFTGEGYLSFTLPVTPTQHLWVKLLTSILFGFFSFVATLLSLIIITAGEVLNEIIKAFVFLFGKVVEAFAFEEWFHSTAYFIELLILLLLSSCSGILLYYACIAIGQLSKKNRVLCAVGVYFAYYFITQIIGTVLAVSVAFMANTSIMEKIGEFIASHPIAFIHIILCAAIIFAAAISFVFFYITRRIMTKKLNLE